MEINNTEDEDVVFVIPNVVVVVVVDAADDVVDVCSSRNTFDETL